MTRAILMALIADPPPGYRIEPVLFVADGFLFARRFACECLSLPDDGLPDDPVLTRRGDIFIGLDGCTDIVPSIKSWFLEQRRHAMQSHLRRARLGAADSTGVLPAGNGLNGRRLDEILSQRSPMAWFVSRARPPTRCMNGSSQAQAQRVRPLSLGFFHLGADLHAGPTTGLSEDAMEMLAKIRSCPTFLMVGDVERRKGYQQALAAMEQLWTDGVDANLAIVGAKGRMMDDFIDRLQRHPERDSRLLWLQGISGEMMKQVCRSARALLAAAECEDFDLTLIEAAQHGLPIIARDIPGYREVAGEHAYYFRGNEAVELADALRIWLSLGDGAPASSGIHWLTWQESSRQLLDVVLGDRRITCWSDANHIPQSANAAARSLDLTSNGPGRGA